MKIIKLWLELILAPAGVLAWLLLRKKGTHDVLICDHIGDFVYTAVFLRQYRERNHIGRLRVICTKRMESLKTLFPEAWDSYRAVDGRFLRLLLYPCRSRLGRYLYRRLRNVTAVEPSRDFSDLYAYVEPFPNLTLRDCIRYGVLRLPEKAEGDRPQGCGEKEEKQGKQVLLCPAAGLTEWKRYLPFFRELSGALRERGYWVIWNDEGMPLDGFVRRAGKMQWVIGIRSGLLDLAAVTGCRVLALYPKECRLIRFFDLRRMNENGSEIVQYRLREDGICDLERLLLLFR